MKKLFVTIFAVCGLTALFALPAQAQVNVFQQCSGSNPQANNTAICKATNTGALFGPGSIWNRILNVFTMVIGAVCVLMIIIGGLRYVTSNGDSNQIGSAKNTILYAVVGLVLALMSSAIVNFVLINI